ncbi:MAG: hypothetical protein MPI95_03635 [Nitrosopumilus sp.]|nr:hypothetical protein [Nitrosopumilus sp.]CAI9831869.1 conserved exported hypothetical protein [Nitrosopumilaceae archaeon]MDA7941628.1 hypothetical protein [Nitrosopumilus sp.]MDA7943797.1 hypothetical protein [Nitrosopumilus sp.]MDA7945159.1 hypothetical protein [Nitrosopumilus sp.]
MAARKRPAARSVKRRPAARSARKPAKARKAAKPKARKPAKPKAKKAAFGGYAISFAGRKETVEQVFGSKPIPPSQMTKKIWAFVKAKGLSNK